jgi:deferrochelatase/peroxidase EfeB
MQEITVAPVLVRDMQIPEEFKSGCELVIAASTLDQIVEQQAAGSVTGLLVQLAAIRWHEKAFRVTKVDSELFAGSEYLYHLQVME